MSAGKDDIPLVIFQFNALLNRCAISRETLLIFISADFPHIFCHRNLFGLLHNPRDIYRRGKLVG